MDEDLEEMKFFREKYKTLEAIDKKKIISYKFELKSQKKSSSAPKPMKSSEDNTVEDPEDNEMSKVMGFSTFGRTKSSVKNETKTARKFDFDKLLAERPVANKWKPLTQPTDETEDKDNIDSNDSKTNVNSNEDNSEVNDNKMTEKTTEVSNETDSDDDLIGPPLPPGFQLDSENTEEKSEEELSDEEMISRYDVLPISHEIELIHGSKSVTALALDPNGSRLVAGGVDYEMRFWDFQGMDSSLQSFRSITPCECHPIKNLEFSANGDVILVISGACIAKIVDRDGFVKGETIKGDQYLTDMSNTKGHTAMLNDGVWNPREKDQFATSSNDGTVRIWDIQNLKTHKSVIKPRSSGGLRAAPNTCRYTRNAELISVGCNDGSVQMWDTRRSFVNTSAVVREAHAKGSEISCIQFSYDGNCLLSRGTDDSLKLWDMKALKTPLFVAKDLFNRFSMTDCFFSPDDKLIATGVSCLKGEEFGRLVFYSRQTSELMHEINVSKGAVIRCSWHPKLNQIAAGSANGVVKVYYDPNRSERGAKLCVVKQKRKYRESYEMVSQQIIAPHSLPLFKTERKKSWRLQMLKDRKDPVKSRRPELPVTGPGAGGRIASAGNTFASFIAKQLGVKNKIDDSIDAREAILRHAKEAEDNPYWVSPAYAATQPKPVFADESKEDEEEEGPNAKKAHLPV